MVAITGATGAVGGRVVRALTGRGVSLRLVIRPGHRFSSDSPYDIREASGYGEAEEMRAALEGASTLFLIPAHESARRVEEHRIAVSAAREAGVDKIAYLPFYGAAPDATFTLARDHFLTEAAIRETGLSWTFPRINLYINFLPARTAPAAAGAVLATGGHRGETLDLTGPEAFSLAEATDTMSAASGRSIRHVEETDDEAYRSRAVYEAPMWELEDWVSTYQAIRDGSLAGVSEDFERVVPPP